MILRGNGAAMDELQKTDVQRIHERIDALTKDNNTYTVELVQKLSTISVSLARVEEAVKRIPECPAQPCMFHAELKKDFIAHKQEHKDARTLWEKPLISAAIDCLKMGIVAVITWYFVR